MCIECWWECLNELQRVGMALVAIAFYCHVGAQIIMRISWLRSALDCDEWYEAHMLPIAVPLVVIVAVALCSCVIYGLYGAISCLF